MNLKNSARILFSIFAVLVFQSISTATSYGIDRAPNVVVFLTDDQGWGDLSLNGNTDLKTPNIDSLAKDGASFDRFYVCPVCSPTRAEFLTGRYHARGGVYSTSAGGERLDLDETTIGDVFKEAGYATGAFGKWHNGMQYPYHPNGRGFDEFYGFCSGHWGNYFDPMLENNGKIVKGEGFCIDDFTNKTIEFIEKNKDKPFLAYVPYNTPHSPMQVPDEYWDRFKDKKIEMHSKEPKKEQDKHLRCALAMCENIDWNVGRVLKKIETLGLKENTIVIYFCDNGPNGWRWNGGMKGKKGSTDEGGVRSPLLVRWPKKIPASTKIMHNASVTDLLPTLAELAAIQPNFKKKLDGRSVANLLLNKKVNWRERPIFSAWKGKLSVKQGEYRLDNNGQLFNLEADPEQKTNIAKKRPKLADELRMKVNAFRNEVVSELPKVDSRPFIIAHPGHQFTQIPARDGTAHGNIKRSNKFPNCSYFLNWKSTDDKITWEAEVAESGTFEVEIYYACPSKDVGSSIELRFNDSTLETKITEPHDPPVRGAAEDRFKRVESYVKNFKTMKMGTIDLKKGKGTLTLKATNIPGTQAMEFRLLMLKRLK